jgi:hypothetical protein
VIWPLAVSTVSSAVRSRQGIPPRRVGELGDELILTERNELIDEAG